MTKQLSAFTLIELLVVITIIALLMALLLPAIGIIRNRAKSSQASDRVTQIHWVLQNYAAEDRRRRFPPQTGPADFTIKFDPAGAAPGNFNAVESLGFTLDWSDFTRTGAPPYTMMDPWARPYQYKVDDDLRTTSTPQRPLDLPSWNAQGTRPWAYVWSKGRDDAADGTNWIYHRDDGK